MKKFLLAPALAALAMFILGAIYWMSPFPYKVLGRVADDAGAAAALAKIFPATGTYLIPGAYLDEKVATELFERGPSAEVHFVKEGHPILQPAVFAKGYLHYFFVALLLMVLLVKCAPAFENCFWCRVRFVTFIGVIGSVFVDFSEPIWWHHPWGWHLVYSAYNVIEFLVAGLVLAKFAGTPPTPAEQNNPPK